MTGIRPLLDTARRTSPVIAFDNAGVGRSSGPVPTTVHGMAEGAVYFIRHLRLDQVDLLGWSMGGAVAQDMTLTIRSSSGDSCSPGPVQAGSPRRLEPPHMCGKSHRSSSTTTKTSSTSSSRSTPTAAPRASPTLPVSVSVTRIEGRPSPRRRQRPGHRDLRLGQRRGVLAAQAWRDQDPGAGRQRRRRRHDPRLQLVCDGSADSRHAELILYPRAGHGFLFQHPERFAQAVTQFLA